MITDAMDNEDLERFRYLQLVRYVLALGILIATGALIISTAGLVDANNDRVKDIILRAEQDVTLSAVKTEAHVVRTQQVLRKAAVAVGGGLINLRCDKEVSQDSEISLLFASREGVVEGCTNDDVAGYLNLNIAQKEYFAIPKDTGEEYVSKVEKIGNSGAVVVSAPVHEVIRYTSSQQVIGPFEGVLFNIIDLEDLHYQYFMPLANADERSYFLFDLEKNHTLLSHGLQKSVENDELEPVRKFLRPIPISGEVLKWKGERLLVVTRDIVFGAERWRLVVTEKIPYYISARLVLMAGLEIVLIVVMGVGLILISRKKKWGMDGFLRDGGLSGGPGGKHGKVWGSAAGLEKKLTLADFSVTVGKEDIKADLSEIALKSGKVYILCSDEIESGYELFAASLARERLGLIFSRTFFGEAAAKFGIRLTPTIRMGGDNEIYAANIVDLIKEFSQNNHEAVILIDSFEYLVLREGLERSLTSFYDIKSAAAESGAIVIIKVDSKALSPETVARVEAVGENPYLTSEGKDIFLLEQETRMLDYINLSNIERKAVTFGEITRRFNITKPTTRSKMKRLEGLGLISIEEDGRVKNIKITSKGRILLKDNFQPWLGEVKTNGKET